MIQRIQTILLLLSSACMILFLILPVWLKFDPASGEMYKIFSTYLFYQANPEATVQFIFLPYAYSGGVALLSILISWIEIFKYKKRLTQIKLGTLNSLLITGSLVYLVYLTYNAQSEILPNILGQYKLGLFMPAIALIMNSIANRFIRKDEKLVRSVDRIRWCPLVANLSVIFSILCIILEIPFWTA